jgi:hypothetical protein
MQFIIAFHNNGAKGNILYTLSCGKHDTLGLPCIDRSNQECPGAKPSNWIILFHALQHFQLHSIHECEPWT